MIKGSRQKGSLLSENLLNLLIKKLLWLMEMIEVNSFERFVEMRT